MSLKSKLRPGLVGEFSQPPPVVKHRLSVSSPARKVAKALGINAPESGRFTQESFDAFCESVIEKMGAATGEGEAGAVKCLSRSASADFADLLTERAARTAEKVKGLVKAGRVPVAVEADIVSLLSVRHGFALSATGQASAVDVRATVEKVLAAIPDQACVPIKDRLKTLSLADGQSPTDPPEFDAAAELVARKKRLAASGVKMNAD